LAWTSVRAAAFQAPALHGNRRKNPALVATTHGTRILDAMGASLRRRNATMPARHADQ
jgi:hypothetical protein